MSHTPQSGDSQISYAPKPAVFEHLSPLVASQLCDLSNLRSDLTFKANSCIVKLRPSFSGASAAQLEDEILYLQITIDGLQQAAIGLPLWALRRFTLRYGKLEELDKSVACLLIELALDRPFSALEEATGMDICVTGMTDIQPQATHQLISKGKIDGKEFNLRLFCENEILSALAQSVQNFSRDFKEINHLSIPLTVTTIPILLPWCEVSAIEPGDALIFQNSDTQIKHVRCLVGKKLFFNAEYKESKLESTSEINKIPKKNPRNSSIKFSPKVRENEDNKDLDEINIEISFEIGRTSMNIGDIKSISDGYIFSLDENTDSRADIMIDGEKFGEGEIVKIGDALGVRINSISKSK